MSPTWTALSELRVRKLKLSEVSGCIVESGTVQAGAAKKLSALANCIQPFGRHIAGHLCLANATAAHDLGTAHDAWII